MFKINKKTEYALIVLKFMASKKDKTHPISTREICQKYSIPFDTTSKIMQLLNNEGILKSIKGIHGGYYLEYFPENISLKQLIFLIEGKDEDEISMCVNANKGPCDLIETCNIVEPMSRLKLKMAHFLEDITLKELLLN